MMVFKENGKHQQPAFRTDHREMKEKRAIFYSARTEQFLYSQQNKSSVEVQKRTQWESVSQEEIAYIQ